MKRPYCCNKSLSGSSAFCLVGEGVQILSGAAIALLKPHGLVVFTLKVPRVETVDLPSDLFEQIVQTAATAGLRLFAQTHLTYNRHEFTLFLEQARG